MNERWLRYVAGTRAELLLRQGRVEPARRVIEGLLEAIGYPNEKSSIELVAALPLAAEIELAAGAADRALTFATDAVAVAGRHARDPEQSGDVGRAWLQVARTRRAGNDGAGEREALERALVALANGLGPDHALSQEARRRLRALGAAPGQRVAADAPADEPHVGRGGARSP
jgi:hypothetical protein